MRRATALVLGVLVALAGGGCASGTSQPAGAGTAGIDPAFIKEFEGRVQGGRVVSAKSGDIDGDGTADLVAVYETPDGVFRTRALLARSGGMKATNEFKAPVEAQVVELRDIDGKTPTEVVVRGSKTGQVGYAIYRVEGERLLDVFNSGMANCCGR